MSTIPRLKMGALGLPPRIIPKSLHKLARAPQTFTRAQLPPRYRVVEDYRQNAHQGLRWPAFRLWAARSWCSWSISLLRLSSSNSMLSILLWSECTRAGGKFCTRLGGSESCCGWPAPNMLSKGSVWILLASFLCWSGVALSVGATSSPGQSMVSTH